MIPDEFLALNGRRLRGNEQELATLVCNVADNLPEHEVARRLRSLVADGPANRPFHERYPGVIEDLDR